MSDNDTNETEYLNENDDLNEVTVSPQVIDKIKSKMDVGKFFAGFISLFLGIAFKDLANHAADTDRLISYSVGIGFFFILAALAFSVATIFAYDRLLMPPKFWLRRENYSFVNEILYHEMRKAWVRLFRPAVGTFFVGLLGFLIAVLKKPEAALIIWLTPICWAFLVFKLYSTIGRQILD